jgi:hypothetical protein
VAQAQVRLTDPGGDYLPEGIIAELLGTEVLEDLRSAVNSGMLAEYTPFCAVPYRGRILLSNILGRRRPVGFVRESKSIKVGTILYII